MKTCIVVVAMALSGCAALSPTVDKAADAYDQARLGAEFTMCRAISIGAWVRAYGNDPERAKAWKTICHPQVSELPTAQ